MILDDIVDATKRRLLVAGDRERDEMAGKALACGGAGAGGTPFKEALSAPGISFICEVKKASPSKGIIAEDFPYLQIAQEYEEAGAAAISVLTEPDFFKGSDDYLRKIAQKVSLPVLRKDFIVDDYQIYEAKVLGAKAILLICALLDEKTLCSFLALAGELKLDALVETHDEAELKKALRCGAEIIGVNNRDLKTFNVDINNSIRLRPLVPPGKIFVAESGINNADDIKALRDGGVDAVLVGEALMRQKDKSAFLRGLCG
jgi:indole-3-glycerol phosphate synthase